MTAQLDATWADSERVWPPKWLTRKDPHPAASIVRHLRLDDISAAQQAKVMAHLAQLDAKNMPPITSFEAAGLAVKRKANMGAGPVAAVWAALQKAPLRHVTICNNVPELYTLVESMIRQPALRDVESITLDHLSDDTLRALVASPQLGALRRLTLRSQRYITAADAKALRTHLGGQLEALSVSYSIGYVTNLPVDEAAWRALWATPWPALRELSMHMKLTHAPISVMLAATPALGQLRLSGAVLDGGGSTALRALALSRVAATDAELARLLDGLGALRELTLGQDTPLDALTAAALGRLGALRSLELSNAPASAAAWEELAARGLARIESLTIGDRTHGKDDAILGALASAHMPALKALDLSQAELTVEQEERVAALLTSAVGARLERVALKGKLCEHAGQALRGLTSLRHLALNSRAAHDSAALWDALRGARLPALRELRCGALAAPNMLDALGTMDLPALRMLAINMRSIDSAAFDQLAAIPWLYQCELLADNDYVPPDRRDRFNHIYVQALGTRPGAPEKI